MIALVADHAVAPAAFSEAVKPAGEIITLQQNSRVRRTVGDEADNNVRVLAVSGPNSHAKPPPT